MVFVGSSGAPGSHCSNSGGGPYATVGTTPVIAEKPYIYIDSAGKYYLRVPRVETNKVGPTTNFNNADQVDFSNVYVAKASDSAATINSKLSAGRHIVFAPGIYKLDDSINVTRAGTVLLGIGFPTLIAGNGKPIVLVGNVDGVRVGGLLFDAGQGATSSLVQWGNPGYAGSASNPGVFYDAFARCGGTNDPNQYQVQVDSMVTINSGNVVIDNSWLWRADHGVSGSVSDSQNPNNHGIVVNGASVRVYGLAVEHQLKDLVSWNGENGEVYFYQSEFPYDVTQDNYGTPGYTSYRVATSVANHKAWGVGAYSYFRDHAVNVSNGIVTGTGSGVQIVNPMSVFLNGFGSIDHVINGRGNPVNAPGTTSYVC